MLIGKNTVSRKKPIRVLIAALALCLSWAPALAVVDMKNANYSNGFKDISLEGWDFPLEYVSRTYNSRSLYDGQFGFGWCSDFETRLDFSYDGAISVIHCGAGQEDRFEPEGADLRARRDALITRIMQGVAKDARQAGQQVRLPLALSRTDRIALQQRLETSQAREDFARRLDLPRPAPGSRYLHLDSVLRFKGDGYELQSPGPRFSRFDLQGRLIQIEDSRGRTATLNYADNRISQVVSGSGHYLNFEYGKTGKISRIVGKDGREASYRHSAAGDLVEAKNAWGNTYAFRYDALHNLTGADWPDGTGTKLFYDTARDWVVSFGDRDNCVELYRYFDDPADSKNHYSSRVAKRCKGEATTRSLYDFRYQRSAGNDGIKAVTAIINGRSTAIQYDMASGNPILIDRDGARAEYSYDNRGRLREARSAATRLQFVWDGESGRARQMVVEHDEQRRELAAEYNAQGELLVLREGKETLARFAPPEEKKSREELARFADASGGSHVLRCTDGSAKRCALVDAAGSPRKIIWRGANLPLLEQNDKTDARKDETLLLVLLAWSADRGWLSEFASPLGEAQQAALPGVDTPAFIEWRRRFDAAYLAQDHAAALVVLKSWRQDLPGAAMAAQDEWADAAYQLGLQAFQRGENTVIDKAGQAQSLAVAREAFAAFLEVADGSRDPALQQILQQGTHLYAATLYRLRLWHEAIAVWERLRAGGILTQRDREVYDVEGRLATAYQMVGRHREAMPLLAEKLAATERADPMSRQTAALQVELADLHAGVGDVGQAERLYRNAYLAYAIQSKQGDFSALDALRKLSEFLRSQGRQGEANSLYARAVAIARERFPDQIEALGYLLLREIGHAFRAADYERGLRVMNELELAVSGRELSPKFEAEWRDLRGYAWGRLGRLQAALDEFDLAARAAVNGKLAEDGGVPQWLLSDWSIARYEAGQFKEAIRIAQELVADSDATLPPRHFRRGNNLGLLARYLLADGQFDEGAAAMEQALAILKAWPGTEPWRLIRLQNDYTRSRLRQGQLDAAERLSAQALLLTEQSGNDAVRWRTYALRAEVFAEKKDDAAAAFWAKRAIGEIERIRARLSAVDPALFQDFVSDKSDVYRLLFDVLLRQNRLGEAEEALLLLKRDEQLATRSGKDDGNASLSKREQAWQKRYGEISGRLSRIAAELAQLERKQPADLGKAEQKRLEQLRIDQEAATQAFRAATDEIDREARAAVQGARDEEQKKAAARLVDIAALGTKNNGALQQVLEKIGDGVVALQYVVLPKKTLILVTTPQLQYPREIPIESEQLTRMIYEFRSRLQDHTDWTFRETAQQLHELLIKPIEKDLEQYGARTIMLSLDYKLRYLPFAALHDGKGYLSDRYDLAYFNAASLTALALGDKPAPLRFLGFGVTKERKDLKLAALGNVDAELSGIVKGSPSILPGVRYLDNDFTIEKLRSAVREDYQILHIASHFVLESGDPRNSYLLLGRGELSLAEFQNLNFGRVRWATFSACETAMGGRGQNGSEMDSLAVASHDRGVKTVLATLWPVADVGVPDFMKSLYSRFSPGKPRISKAAAVRDAQEEFKQGKYGEKFRHPRFWAPYVLLGDWL